MLHGSCQLVPWLLLAALLAGGCHTSARDLPLDQDLAHQALQTALDKFGDFTRQGARL